MRDASLDEFLGDGRDGGRERDEEDLEPARATSTFDPDGAACAVCGDSAERLWRDGDALVCGDCKEW